MLVYRWAEEPVNDSMLFKTMKLEETLRLLAGQENIIAPAFEEQQRYFKTLSCHRCGSPVRAAINSRQLFRPGDPLPNTLAQCTACGCEFEPYTKIEVTLPNREPPEDD